MSGEGKTISAEEYNAMQRVSRSKYGAKPVERHGIRFASRAEAHRYDVLLIMMAAGEISQLEVHPRYPLIVNGVKIGHYTADFRYVDATGLVIEDVKGGNATRTEAYRLRKRVFEASTGIDVTEIDA